MWADLAVHIFIIRRIIGDIITAAPQRMLLPRRLHGVLVYIAVVDGFGDI